MESITGNRFEDFVTDIEGQVMSDSEVIDFLKNITGLRISQVRIEYTLPYLFNYHFRFNKKQSPDGNYIEMTILDNDGKALHTRKLSIVDGAPIDFSEQG